MHKKTIKVSSQASLTKEFAHIRNNHDRALLDRAARVILGASVIRVFNPGTKDAVLPHLANINVGKLRTIRSQQSYKQWFERELNHLSSLIKMTNLNNRRIRPGLKWGHSSKVLCIYVREVVLCSRYFNDDESSRISKWLYVPIDGVVMRGLKTMGVKLPFKRIRQISKSENFYLVQNMLGDAGQQEGIPRIWFDDIWGSQGSQTMKTPGLTTS